MNRVGWEAAAAVLFVFAVTGCGGSGSSDGRPAAAGVAGGAKVFTSAGCGSCHTLASANATGNVGPNLDQLKPDAATVARQVRAGGNGMPSFRNSLTARQIEDLAAYVAEATKSSAVAKQSFGSIAADFKPNQAQPSKCGRDWRCYEQAFGNLAYYEGAKRALIRFVRAMKTNEIVSQDCHLIAHAIGAGAYVRYRDAGKAFVAAGQLAMTCSSGFYHGVLQRALHGVGRGDLTAAARRLCATRAVNRNYFVLSQCIHGLGHGLMIYTGYDLPLALGTCDRLATRFQQIVCTGGVFMENIQTSLGIRSPWLKKSDPLFPCDVVARRDKLFCYRIVTSHVLDVTGGNWRRTAEWCRRAEPGWVRACFNSFGRDASGRTFQNQAKILRLCRLAGDMEPECIYGAVRDITNTDAGARRSAPFCELVPAGIRRYCFRGIGTVVGGFHLDAAGRKAECKSDVPRRYWRDCYAGANV